MLEHDFFTILMFVTGLYMLILGIVMNTNDFMSMFLFKALPGVIGATWLIFAFKAVGLL